MEVMEDFLVAVLLLALLVMVQTVDLEGAHMCKVQQIFQGQPSIITVQVMLALDVMQDQMTGIMVVTEQMVEMGEVFWR